jgi:hypothetical protein
MKNILRPSVSPTRHYAKHVLHTERDAGPVMGLYAGVAVKAKRKELLALLRKGLRSDQLVFPAKNGPVEWPEIQLTKKTA